MPKKPVGNTFQPVAEVATGTLHAAPATAAEGPRLHYEHPGGALHLGDAVAWLEGLAPGSVDLIVADPPYNLGKADWDQFASDDAYLEWSLRWIAPAARALSERGSLYVCGFSEVLADLRRPAARHFAGCRWLVWHYRNKANLRKDWGRSHESILHLRKAKRTRIRVDDVRVPYGGHTLKYPSHPQATSSQFGGGKPRKDAWRPDPRGAKPRDVIEVPVLANGAPERTAHPTQKPEALIRKLVLASSEPGQTVADPFAGAGTTLVCAEQLGRRWLGCELDPTYASWAVSRLERVAERDPEVWIARDREQALRRQGIR